MSAATAGSRDVSPLPADMSTPQRGGSFTNTTGTAAGLALLTAAAFGMVLGAAESINWRRGPDLPLPRGGYSSAWHRQGLLLAGGTYWEDGKKYWTDRVDHYNPAQGRWTQWKPLPLRLAYGSMAELEGKLYLLGGADESKTYRDIWRLQGDRWIRSGEMPLALVYTAAVSVGARIYVIGGGFSVTDLTTATATFGAFDPKTGQWTQLAPVPGPPRVLHAAAALGHSIYVFGGATQEAGKQLINLDDASRFDLDSNTWSSMKKMPAPVRALWATPAEQSIYLIGGYSDHFMDDVYRYDPATGACQLVSHMPQRFCDAEFHYHKGSFYGAGGEDRGGSRFPGTLIGSLGR